MQNSQKFFFFHLAENIYSILFTEKKQHLLLIS